MAIFSSIHDRGRCFDPIDTKHGLNVGFIMIHIEFVDKLCGVNRSGNTLLQKKYYNHYTNKGRNFDPIVYKLGTAVGLV